MTAELLRLRPDVSAVVTPAGELYVVTWLRGQRIGKRSSATERLLAKLAVEHCSTERLYDLAGTRRPVDRLLALLHRGGWLQTTRVHDGRRLYTVSPLRPGGPRRPTTGAAARPRLFGGLSRFTVVRRDGDSFLVESPLADADILVHDPGLLRYLAEHADDGVAVDFQRDLLRAGLAVGTADDERGELRLAQWTPHELWFHACSRAATRGRVGQRFGATAWGRARFAPVPARPHCFPGARISLYRPDLAALRRDDTTLTAALEDRRSIRSYGADPLTLAQVGDFLFRCARARGVTPGDVELVDRVYPSGGKLGELELYVVTQVVAGLEPGIYHYDSHDHCLVATGATTRAAQRLLADAGGLLVPPGRPPLLIVVTARFGRLMWKYEGLSYALALKHVGALYQVMYLVATAMGLAPCALGTGDSEAFCDAVGLDYLSESSVGEFALGVPAGAGREAS